MDDGNQGDGIPLGDQLSGSPLPRKSTNKSTMEKKRRERINRSLCELKSLVLGSIKKDASYYSKLEKADILEMTVEHVRFLQTQLQSAHSTDGLESVRYRAGFATCATEMTSLLTSLPGIDETVKFNLLKNLNEKCSTATANTNSNANGSTSYLNHSVANPVHHNFQAHYDVLAQQSTRDSMTRCKENIEEIHDKCQSIKIKPERNTKRKASNDDCPVSRKMISESDSSKLMTDSYHSDKSVNISRPSISATVLKMPVTSFLPIPLGNRHQSEPRRDDAYMVWRPW